MKNTFPKLVRLHKTPSPDCVGIADSPIGFILAAWENDALIRVHILPAGAEKNLNGFFKDWGWKINFKRDDSRATTLVESGLFTKSRWTGDFPATLTLGFFGTDFQWAVMNKMLKIPSGKTVTYTGLAKAANGNNAARAAGSVCATNPLPLIVPCHRILATNGGLGGYGYGTALKRQLLDWEAKA